MQLSLGVLTPEALKKWEQTGDNNNEENNSLQQKESVMSQEQQESSTAKPMTIDIPEGATTFAPVLTFSPVLQMPAQVKTLTDRGLDAAETAVGTAVGIGLAAGVYWLGCVVGLFTGDTDVPPPATL